LLHKGLKCTRGAEENPSILFRKCYFCLFGDLSTHFEVGYCSPPAVLFAQIIHPDSLQIIIIIEIW
jgi:hypothetical protein